MAILPKTLQPASVKSKLPPGAVPAAKAKTHLLQLLDTVDRDRQSITITKRGRAVARLVPVENKQRTPLWGCMKGTGRITGDIVGPEPDSWEAMTE